MKRSLGILSGALASLSVGTVVAESEREKFNRENNIVGGLTVAEIAESEQITGVRIGADNVAIFTTNQPTDSNVRPTTQFDLDRMAAAEAKRQRKREAKEKRK